MIVSHTHTVSKYIIALKKERLSNLVHKVYSLQLSSEYSVVDRVVDKFVIFKKSKN